MAQRAIDALIKTRLEEGTSPEDIATELAGRAEVEAAEASPKVLVYKVSGGRPIPYFLAPIGAMGATANPGGLIERLGSGNDTRSRTASRRLVASQDGVYPRDSLLADSIEYEIPYRGTSEHLELIERTPGYDSGDALVHENKRYPGRGVQPGEILDPFASWRSYPYVSLHSHGMTATLGGRPVVFYGLTTSFASVDDCWEWLEGSSAVGVLCKDFQLGSGDPAVTLIITLDTLYELNSAPLTETVFYSGACDVGQDLAFGSSDPNNRLLAANGAMIGWTEAVFARDSDAASIEFMKWALEKGLRSKDAFDKIETRTSDLARIALRGKKDVRAREIVHFTDEDGEVINPETTRLLKFDYTDGEGWTADLTVRIDGVMPDETGAFATTLSVSEQSAALGARFEPETLNPSSPGALPVDEERHLWIVPVTLKTGEQKPRVGQRIDLLATTQLPEGGESRGRASFIVARPDCAFAHIQTRGGPGAGDFNVNRVVTYESDITGTFSISAALAERIGADTIDEYVDETTPTFVLTVTGRLPAAGQTTSYSNEQLSIVMNTSDSDPFATYVTEGINGTQGDVRLNLTAREDGSFEGTLRGIAAYPDPNAEDDYSDATVDIVFLSAPVDDADETYQCF